MSSTQDLCDGVATLYAAVRRYDEISQGGGGDLAEAWAQVRRAVGYMAAMAAWKERMAVAEILAQGVIAPDLDERWEMDDPRPFA